MLTTNVTRSYNLNFFEKIENKGFKIVDEHCFSSDCVEVVSNLPDSYLEKIDYFNFQAIESDFFENPESKFLIAKVRHTFSRYSTIFALRTENVAYVYEYTHPNTVTDSSETIKAIEYGKKIFENLKKGVVKESLSVPKGNIALISIRQNNAFLSKLGHLDPSSKKKYLNKGLY